MIESAPYDEMLNKSLIIKSLHIFSGESPLPEAQSSLAPSSLVLGGRLPWDAYNNGGEWLNSVFDVGSSLVSDE